MSEGTIFYAVESSCYILRFVGDVRLTLCLTLDKHLDEVAERGDITETIIDLTAAENLDSTTLGLVARLAVRAKKGGQPLPIIICDDDDINQILRSMGLDKVFILARSYSEACIAGRCQEESFQALEDVPGEETAVKQRVIAAHKLLMSLNAENRQTFKNLLAALE